MKHNTYFQQAAAFQLIPEEEGAFFEADGRVSFRLSAQGAQSLSVCIPDGEAFALCRGEEGLWQGTFDLGKGFRYIDIKKNGQTVLIPQLPIGFGYSRTINFIDIPFAEDDFYQAKDVPHGSVSRHYFYSSVTGNMESCLVYCPPERSFDALPTLYLQHGFGESETGWVYQGRVNFVMDNLLAQKKVRPMRIVMCNGMVQINGSVDTAIFPKVLVQDVIPYIESAYPVLQDKWNRAVAGLSMGSMHSSMAALTHPELFGYVGLFSGFLRMLWTEEQPHLKGLDDARAFERNYRVFYRAMGNEDVFLPVFHEDDVILEQRGIQTLRKLYNGKHEWQVWRACIQDFLPLIF